MNPMNNLSVCPPSPGDERHHDRHHQDQHHPDQHHQRHQDPRSPDQRDPDRPAASTAAAPAAATPSIADRFDDLLAPLSARRRRGLIARLSVGYYEGWRPSRAEVAELVAQELRRSPR